MKIKRLLPGTLLIMFVFVRVPHVSADALPSGCYVTDADRAAYSGSYTCTDCDPPPCFDSSDGLYYFMTPASASTSTLIDAYGDAVYAIINSYYQNVVQSAANYAAYQAQVNLVKKLRRACGARCKRIK